MPVRNELIKTEESDVEDYHTFVEDEETNWASKSAQVNTSASKFMDTRRARK